MANTYASLHYHIIFSTKNRIAFLKPEIEQRVWAYIGGVARKHKMTAMQIGGCDDHVHALVMAPPTIAPSQIAQYLKGDSSKWIHETFPELLNFAWQARRLRHIHSQQIKFGFGGDVYPESASASSTRKFSG